MFNQEISILSELSSISSPSGQEDDMRQHLISKCQNLVDSYNFDAIGNLFFVKQCVNSSCATVMIIAHMDEIGIIVTYIEENGLLRFDKIGGVDVSVLIGRKVKIDTDNGYIIGVIGSNPPAIKLDKCQKLEISDLWIDFGATSKEDAQKYVCIGAAGVVFCGIDKLLNDTISMRAADNKAGLAIIISLLESLKETRFDSIELLCVASVQEEIGLRGVATLCINYHPDYVIVLDVTHATDCPGIKKSIYGDIKLGCGPVIPVSPDSSKDFQSLIRETATRNNIPYQIQVFARPTCTDLNAISIEAQQTKTGLICVPCRYMHSPNEIVSLMDIKNVVKILLHLILELDSSI